MKTMGMAKLAFKNRHAVDEWFKDSAPNFEMFAKMVRTEEREECARVCDERAEKCSVKLETTDDQDDRTELESLAWQFSVLAAEIRKRSR
jgi:hypothetical protein